MSPHSLENNDVHIIRQREGDLYAPGGLHTGEAGWRAGEVISTARVKRSRSQPNLRWSGCPGIDQKHRLFTSAVFDGIDGICRVAVNLDSSSMNCPPDSPVQRHELGSTSATGFAPFQKVGTDAEDAGHGDNESKFKSDRLLVSGVRSSVTQELMTWGP